MHDPVVQFFKDNIARLDPLCCNFSFVNGRAEEIIYNIDGKYPEIYRAMFDAVMEDHFPDIERERIEAVSFQQADGGLYQEDKFLVSVDNAKMDCFLYPELNCFNPFLFYGINSGVDTKNRSCKFYDLDTTAYTCMEWPSFIQLFDKYGAGVGIKPDIVGIYFLSHEYQKVIDWVGLPDPVPAELKDVILPKASIHNFGLTFNIKTKEMVKLSYFFYNDQYREDVMPYLKERNETV
jgi:hypothetical protein